MVHMTGTNGKTSTSRAISSLLAAHELSVGTYTSPHLVSVTERLRWNGAPVSEETFAALIAQFAALERLLHDRPTWFELVTAAGFVWFADLAVDAAVVEVGLGGTWDATNAADGVVAVITSIGLDHTEFLGDTHESVAAEKAGIIKPDAAVVVGYLDEGPRRVIGDAAKAVGAAEVVYAGDDFAVTSDRVALGGRLVSIRTPRARYDEVFLPLHGAHQSENLACALVAAEAFFDRGLDEDLVQATVATLTSPGRLEVIAPPPIGDRRRDQERGRRRRGASRPGRRVGDGVAARPAWSACSKARARIRSACSRRSAPRAPNSSSAFPRRRPGPCPPPISPRRRVHSA